MRLPLAHTFSTWRRYSWFLYKYTRSRGYRWFVYFESLKDIFVGVLYRKRGKYARPVLHVGAIGLTFFVILVGPYLLEEAQRGEGESSQFVAGVFNGATANATSFDTLSSEEVQRFRGGEIISYIVQDGDTLISIAQKFNLEDADTIRWENNLPKDAKLKPGQELKILPVDGVRHKVARGETIYTIAKRYGLEGAEAQAIVNYPFNEFRNDETFELTVGQMLMVPNGVKPEETVAPRPRVTITANAGAVTATGSFVWPASGGITQRFSFYHKAWDIANRGGGPILAADAGRVIAAGWDSSGYGNRVMIDHGNGYVTLYGHMIVLQVTVGQTVNRGSVVGQMGSTGRSTGTHLHFEIRQGSVLLDPGRFLR